MNRRLSYPFGPHMFDLIITLQRENGCCSLFELKAFNKRVEKLVSLILNLGILPGTFSGHCISFQTRLERNVGDGVTTRATLDGNVGCLGANG